MDINIPAHQLKHAWILKAIANVLRMKPTDLVSPTPLRGRLMRSGTNTVYRTADAKQHIVVEVAIVLQEGVLELNGRNHRFCPPEVVILPPLSWHREGALQSRPYSCLWLNGGAEVLMGIVSRHQPRQGWDTPWVKHLFGNSVQRLINPLESKEVVESLRKDRAAFENFRAHLLAVLAELQCISAPSRSVPHAYSSANKDTFEHVRRFINGNLHRSITLSDIAHMIHLSPCYLNRLFHEQHGEPIHSYLLRLRMEKAMKLLLSTDLPVKEIARQVGFPDPLYFSRRFRSRFGYAPSKVGRNGP